MGIPELYYILLLNPDTWPFTSHLLWIPESQWGCNVGCILEGWKDDCWCSPTQSALQVGLRYSCSRLREREQLRSREAYDYQFRWREDRSGDRAMGWRIRRWLSSRLLETKMQLPTQTINGNILYAFQFRPSRLELCTLLLFGCTRYLREASHNYITKFNQAVRSRGCETAWCAESIPLLNYGLSCHILLKSCTLV